MEVAIRPHIIVSMPEMVRRAREIGAVQKVWRKLNPEDYVHLRYVDIYESDAPVIRKHEMLCAILNRPFHWFQIKGSLIHDRGELPADRSF